MSAAFTLTLAARTASTASARAFSRSLNRPATGAHSPTVARRERAASRRVWAAFRASRTRAPSASSCSDFSFASCACNVSESASAFASSTSCWHVGHTCASPLLPRSMSAAFNSLSRSARAATHWSRRASNSRCSFSASADSDATVSVNAASVSVSPPLTVSASCRRSADALASSTRADAARSRSRAASRASRALARLFFASSTVTSPVCAPTRPIRSRFSASNAPMRAFALSMRSVRAALRARLSCPAV